MVIDTEDTGEQPAVDMGNLDDFEKDFYQTPKAAEEAPEAEVVEDTDEEVEDSPAESEEVEDLATDEDEIEEEEAEEPKPKKISPTQKRINDLTAKVHQAQRDAETLRRENETLRVAREKEEPEPLRTQLPPDAPKPDAVDKEGNPLYELGEFDPKYIHDLTKFTIDVENKAAKERDRQEDWNRGVEAAQAELAESWVTKVEAAEQEIPTLRDDIVELTNVFDGIEPNYGEYLAMTIMQCDAGPEIMHYFSQNIGEAQKIVASGPAAATLAIGRLEAKLAKAANNEDGQKRNNTRVSNAPKPPTSGARGVNGRQTVRADTSNLDDFEKIFYKK